MRHGFLNAAAMFTSRLRKIVSVLAVVSVSFFVSAQTTPAQNDQATISVWDMRIQQLFEQLGSDDPVMQSEARRQLKEVRLQAVPALLKLLADSSESPKTRSQAANVLGFGQPSVIEAIPTLVKILEDEAQDLDLRKSVARSLRFTIETNVIDVQLSDEPESVLRPDTSFLLPVLVDLVEDPSEPKEIRSDAAWALGGLGPDAQQALPTLVESIRDSESRVRAASVSAIGDIGIAMPEVIPVLIRSLQDEDENVRDWATGAMGQHESKSDLIVNALRQALEDDASWMVRRSSVMALTEIGFDTEGVVPALIVALRDEHDWVRRDAAAALGNAGPVTPEVIPALIAALEDEYAEVKSNAALALGSFGPQARDAIPALTRAILTDYRRSEAYYSEDTIVQALRAIGADMAVVVTSLEEALSGSDLRARRQAAWALAEIGAEGLPALARALTVLGLLAEDELRWELSTIEFPLETTPALSPKELQALIHHYTAERDRLALSTQKQPSNLTQSESALTYLRSLEDANPSLLPMVATVIAILVGTIAVTWTASRRHSGRDGNA